MALPPNFDPLQSSDPQFYRLLSSLKEISLDSAALDAKTKFLIGLAVNASLDRKAKVKCALAQARAAGATKEEVQAVLRLTYFIKGLSTAEFMI